MTYLIKSIATPVVWILLLLIISLILHRPRRKKAALKIGWVSLLIAFLLLFMLSLGPVANWIAYPLEAKYILTSENVLTDIDIVAVLGGGSYLSGYRQQYYDLSHDSYARLCRGVSLYKQSNARTLVFCGTKAMKPFATQLGIPESVILEETDSTNTMENAAHLAKILPAGQNRRIAVVTSAVHLPRAETVFKACFPQDVIVPIPANYLEVSEGGIKTIIPTASHFERSTHALHEWIGILWYMLRY